MDEIKMGCRSCGSALVVKIPDRKLGNNMLMLALVGGIFLVCGLGGLVAETTGALIISAIGLVLIIAGLLAFKTVAKPRCPICGSTDLLSAATPEGKRIWNAATKDC